MNNRNFDKIEISRLEKMATALFAFEWRTKDKDLIKTEFNLTDEEMIIICEHFNELEKTTERYFKFLVNAKNKWSAIESDIFRDMIYATTEKLSVELYESDAERNGKCDKECDKCNECDSDYD